MVLLPSYNLEIEITWINIGVITIDLSSEAMLQDGNVLALTLLGATGLLDYSGQHSYHIFQYVIN